MMIDGDAAAAAAVVAAVGCISKDLPIKYVFLFRSWKIPLISKDKIVVQFGKMIKFMQSDFLLIIVLLFLFVSLAFRQLEARLYEEDSDQ